ncbi:hypothetical protein EBT25_01855 [bacterium]|jgi:hypothetical protein|nr:hypothetical protein [bacterium]
MNSFKGMSKKERKAVVKNALETQKREKMVNCLTHESSGRGFGTLYAWRDRCLAYGDIEGANIVNKMLEHKLALSNKN